MDLPMRSHQPRTLCKNFCHGALRHRHSCVVYHTFGNLSTMFEKFFIIFLYLHSIDTPLKKCYNEQKATGGCSYVD